MLFETLNKFLHPESTEDIRKSQLVKRILLASTGLLGLTLLMMSVDGENNPPQMMAKDDESSPPAIESVTHHVDLNDVWRHKVEDQNTLLQNQMAEVIQMMTEKSHLGGIGETGDTGDTGISSIERLQDLEGRLLELEMELSTQKESNANDLLSGSSAGSTNLNSNSPEDPHKGQIQRFSLNLKKIPLHGAKKTVETTIPAGAFAKTVLLSGLDAAASMNASADPRPMLLRIVDPGTLPRRFKSDLKDCHCTASAFGDLSSERVYARLEKLTCMERDTGLLIETQVAGYIAGSDGKAGIRGVVSSRDGQFLGRSLIGGLFSGLSHVVNPQNRQAQINPFFASSPTPGPDMGTMFASGMAKGATSALDRLSQYYIDRAEQLQPVIQISAGQLVDIVFTEGTFIGSHDVKDKIQNTRIQNEDSTPSAQRQGV